MDEHELTPFDIVMAAADRATAEHQARIDRENEKQYAYGKMWRQLRLPPLFSWRALNLWLNFKYDNFQTCYLKSVNK